MDGIENAQHDISDAKFSVDTAIDLLISIEKDTGIDLDELHKVITTLVGLKGGLEETSRTLAAVREKLDPG